MAAATLLLLITQPYLEIQFIALIYLLPVMISAAVWGLSPGVLAGFLAFLAFNYYFIAPNFTLLVHKSQDLITLIVFLVVSVVTGQLIGRARQGEQAAQSREREATRMYELSSALAGLQEPETIARELAQHTLETFDCDQVKTTIHANKDQVAQTITVPPDSALTRPADLFVPLRTARGLEGAMQIWKERLPLSPVENRLMETYASQGALALERVRLTKSENKARVLEESDQLKSSLLNSVSHELRTPLAAIKASVSFLRSGSLDEYSPASQELLATIEEETDALNLLVGNLLDMSRIESGALKPQPRWNSLSEIAMTVIAKMRKQLQNHRLDFHFPENLPLVPTDYVMISQVFTNLISNSVKYAPPDTTIQLLARVEGDEVHVQVTNQGPPVPEESLDRIFDKFYRITAADRITGTGLGLSICKGIIDRHGGRIWAENQTDCFAFHFTLPLTLDGARPLSPKEASDEQRSADTDR